VDNPYVLWDFVRILKKVAGVWLVEPSRGNSVPANIPPQGYFEFLALMKNARVVMTDSGGLQEEATHPRIKKPVLVLRSSTERPEAVIHGFAKVVGVNPVAVLAELEKVLSEEPKLPDRSPFGDGKAGARMVDAAPSRLES